MHKYIYIYKYIFKNINACSLVRHNLLQMANSQASPTLNPRKLFLFAETARFLDTLHNDLI